MRFLLLRTAWPRTQKWLWRWDLVVFTFFKNCYLQLNTPSAAQFNQKYSARLLKQWRPCVRTPPMIIVSGEASVIWTFLPLIFLSLCGFDVHHRGKRRIWTLKPWWKLEKGQECQAERNTQTYKNKTKNNFERGGKKKHVLVARHCATWHKLSDRRVHDWSYVIYLRSIHPA